MSATLYLSSVVHGNGLSNRLSFRKIRKYGENIAIGTTHVSKIQTALILGVIIVIFIGNTVTMNLSTVVSIRLSIDTEYETYDK